MELVETGFGMGILAESVLDPGPNHDWDAAPVPQGVILDLSAINPSRLPVGGFFVVECIGPDGQRKWIDAAKNGVTNAGIASLLNVYFGAATQITTWYIGLIDNAGFTGLNAADTMASHAGWSEVGSGNTSNSTRPQWSPGAASGGSVVNGTTVNYSMINGSALTVYGVFLVSDSTKAGTTGTLFSTAAFSTGNQPVNNGDTLKITYTVSATSTS